MSENTPSVEAIEAAHVAAHMVAADEYPGHHALYSAGFVNLRLAVSAALVARLPNRVHHDGRPVVDLSASYTAAGLVMDEPKSLPGGITSVDAVITITTDLTDSPVIEQDVLVEASRRAHRLVEASSARRISELVFIITPGSATDLTKE